MKTNLHVGMMGLYGEEKLLLVIGERIWNTRGLQGGHCLFDIPMNSSGCGGIRCK
jgi:hypothetical protein